MSLSLTTRIDGTVCHANISGAMTLSARLPKMSRELAETFARASLTGMIINLTDVTAIDSAGLGELVNIYKMTSDRKVRIALVGVDRRIRDMLALTHLDELLHCYETEAEAAGAVR